MNGKDRFYMWLAWKLPKPLVKWAAVRLLSSATVGQYSDTVVPELTAVEALDRWIEGDSDGNDNN